MTAQTRERILPRLIEQEMRESFLDYSMSVIVQRGPARCSGRAQARPQAHPLRHARGGAEAGQALQEECNCGA